MYRKLGMQRKVVITALSGSLLVAPLTACESLPGTDEQQGAVLGGVAGAAAGAAVGGDENRLMGALIGGALGAGGGYLLGANKESILGGDAEEAQQAVQEAQADPATAADVRAADTADLNDDGFVTMDEVVALEEAGLTDQEILDRLEATDQVFELNAEQEDSLLASGVSSRVVNQLPDINRQLRDDLLRQQQNVISEPAGAERI